MSRLMRMRMLVHMTHIADQTSVLPAMEVPGSADNSIQCQLPRYPLSGHHKLQRTLDWGFVLLVLTHVFQETAPGRYRAHYHTVL